MVFLFFTFGMSNSTTDRVHGELLREWREAQKIDVCTLAGHANLSVAQIQQLESGGASLFYTASIKESAARKVATLLGGDPVAVIRQGPDVAIPLEPSVVDDLIELSKKKASSTKFHAGSSLSYRWIFLSGMTLVLLGSMLWVQKNGQNSAAENFWHQALSNSSETAVQPSPSARLSNDSGTQSAAQLSSVKSVAAVAERVTTVPAASAISEPAAAAMGQAKVVESALCQPTLSDAVLTPFQPNKAGDMVYLVAQKEGAVCVVDGTGLKTLLSLKVNEAKSVYGSPPWRVRFEQTEQVKLYFQGVRLRVPDAKTTAIVLQEGSPSP